MSSAYFLRPKADRDLDEQAYYLPTKASPQRFLLAAHETFGLLAVNPNMGWARQAEHPQLDALRVFRIAGFQRMLVFYLPHPRGVEILRIVHASRNLRDLLRGEGVE